MNRYEITTLSNGLRVASFSMPAVHSVAISVGVDVGARYEDEANNGVSHMLEHMAFKGTTSRTAINIAEQFDAIGGNLNAYTSMEHTVYYTRVLKQDVNVAVDILADIIQRSTFIELELERERNVVLQEIAMHHDTPEEEIFDHLTACAYPNQPIGRSILGTDANVSNMKRDALLSYVAEHYNAGRMVLAFSGNITHAEAVEFAEKYFSGLNGASKVTPSPASYVGGEKRSQKKLEQVHMAMAFPGIPHRDPEYRTIQLLATILGGGMSSRLFQEIREKRGMAYSIYAFASSHTDSGVLGIYGGMGEKEAPEVIKIIADEMHKLADNLPEDELERAKAQVKAGMLMAEESVGTMCETLVRHILVYGRFKPISDVMAEIDRVQSSDIKNMMKRLSSGKLCFSSVGPVSKIPDYAALSASFN